MRHSSAVAILVVTTLTASAPAAARGAARGAAPGGTPPSPNLLLNGHAEEGKGEVPSVWYAASQPADGLRMWLDTKQRRSGAASLAIANTHDYPQPVSNNWAQALQEVPRGRALVLTASIRTEGADAANVCVQCWDESNRMIAYASTPVFRGDREWTRVKAEPVVVPPGTARVIVRAALTGKGDAWFDDLSVEAVESLAAAARLNQPAARGVAPELAALAPGEVVGVLPVTKDAMVLSYLPDWAHGSLDSLGIGNNEGGVRLLLDWTQPEPSEAAKNRYVLALYARKTYAPPGAVPGEEPLRLVPIPGKWNEGMSWKTQPPVAEAAAVELTLAPGEGWKLIDLTPLVRERARPGAKVHGVMLRYTREDRAPDSHTGFGFVSREAIHDQAARRPVVLVLREKKAEQT